MDLKAGLDRIRRILLISSKPDKAQYLQTAKITGLGFILIGVIGFAIFLVVQLIGGL